MSELTQTERLKLDIDMRTVSLLVDAAEVTKWTHELVVEYARLAYAQGYTDALTEPRGKLMRDNGYTVPRRRIGN